MRPSRGMGCINESKIPGKNPKVITRKDDPNKVDVYKKGGAVGLYANMNARKKKGISRSKSESTISSDAYANMKAGFPKGKK
jgi:hypothetical protein